MTNSAITGGQYCIKGLVYQLLVGLDHGMAVMINQIERSGSLLVSATMTLEPSQGGDHEIGTPSERIIEQVKIRTNGKAWTAGEIAEEVLPDLLKAIPSVDDHPTRYRLVTNGELNCDNLLALAARLRSRPGSEDLIAALDDSDKRGFKYGRWMSEREFFTALMRRAGAGDALNFWRLLAGLELEGAVDTQDLEGRIDAVLVQVVDAVEEVPGKRRELVGQMAELASEGGTVRVSALLDRVGLPAERLLHSARLPRLIATRLGRDLAALGYEAAHDVRETPRHAARDLLLISGESGLGKSWRLAALLAAEVSQGRLAVAVAQAATLQDVTHQIIERIWLSGFDRPLELPGLQRRLSARFGDANGVWLTVGVDDVQQRDLLAALHAAHWAQYGIRLVATVPVQLADELARHPLPPSEQRVERFSRAQLRRFLASHGKQMHDLPDDVVELLCTPIFADLYRRTAQEGWSPDNEYELIDGFWRHATFETRGMADAQDDVVALEAAARTLLGPGGHYPWTVEEALGCGLDAGARARLVATGVLRVSPAGVAVTHDRVLNWLVARALVADLHHQRRSAGDIASLITNFDKPGEIAAGLAYRLGYVLLDLIWMGATILDRAIVRDIVEAVLADPQSRIQDGPFIQDNLAGIGPRILPVLQLIARISDTNARYHSSHAARAIGEIGERYPDRGGEIVSPLLAESEDEQAVRAGLIAAGRVAVPAALDRLWMIHRSRREASAALADDADVHLRHEHYDRAQTSQKALARAAAARPEWIARTLRQTSDALSAELLLELLVATEHGIGCEIWQAEKSRFIARIPPGRSVLAKAIGRFGDREEIGRLVQASDEAEFLEPTRRFDALLRVAPERAVGQIETLPEEMLGARSWYSMRRLVRDGGHDAQARLLARYGRGWEAMRDVVLAYWHDIDLIDVPAFEAVIEALEDRLVEVAGTPWTPRGDGHLIDFLSRTRRPDLLASLRSRRGTRFERVLIDLATQRTSRASLCVDRISEQIERLLLAIGGDGYGELASDAISRDTIFAREDGYEAAVRLPLGSPYAAGLAGAVDLPDRNNRENYDLMVALAAHRLDAPLYELIASTAAAYTDALDIRASLGPMSPEIEVRIRADLASVDSDVRIGATCALAFAPPSDAAELLADTLARCPDDDPSALTVVRIANHLRLYAPRSLPQLERMLALPDPHIREAVLPYLAWAGDAEARALVTAAFAAEERPIVDQAALKAAHAISAHEPDPGPATERLRLFLDVRHGIYPLGVIAIRLHDNGALTNEELVELAYTAHRVSAETSAYLIERIAAFDRAEACAIAEGHFARTPSAPTARQILTFGGPDGLEHLLRFYVDDERQRVRWIIARAVRRHGDRRLVVERLDLFARSNSIDVRIAAAELLGWIPGPEAQAIVARLGADPVPEVADAALEAEARRVEESNARALTAELTSADHLGRWSILYALIAIADPYLLENDPDGLAIGAVIDPFGEAFAIGAERAIKSRKDELEKDADRYDRDRR